MGHDCVQAHETLAGSTVESPEDRSPAQKLGSAVRFMSSRVCRVFGARAGAVRRISKVRLYPLDMFCKTHCIGDITHALHVGFENAS